MPNSLVERLSQRFFDKRPGPAVFALKTAGLTYVVVLICTLPLLFIDQSLPEKLAASDLLLESLVALIFAPIAENFMMICMTSFLAGLKIRVAWTVALIAILFAWLHSFGTHQQIASGLFLFATMSYSYLIWAEKPFSHRYLITIGQHFLFNLPGALALLVYSLL